MYEYQFVLAEVNTFPPVTILYPLNNHLYPILYTLYIGTVV